MNTLKWLAVLVALALAAPSVATAAPQQALRLLLLAPTVGAANKSKAATDRQEVESLLARARRAIKEGNLEAADALISQAEKLKVEFSVLHFGDTPKKLRAEWYAAKRTGKRQALQRPSQKFTPELPADQAESAAPGAQQRPSDLAPPKVPTASLDPRTEEPLLLPQSEGRVPELPGSQRPMTSPDEDAELVTRLPGPKRESPIASDGSELRRQSDSHLLSARRALAVGDVRRASAAVEAAKQLGVTYGYHDDKPEKIEAAIVNYRQVMEVLSTNQDSEAARHQLADLLMDQAQQLSRWKDYDEAERLAQSVKALRVNYGPFEAKPDAVLEKIAAARLQETRGAQGSPARETADASSSPNRSQNDASVAGAPPRAAAPYPTTQASFESDEETMRDATAGADEEPPAPDEENPPAAESPEDSEPEESVERTEPVERLPSPNQEPRPIAESGPSAMDLLRLGEEALQDRDTQRAADYFREAYDLREQLDAAAAQRLQDRLQLRAAPTGPRPGGKPESLIDGAASKQQLLAKQLSADVAQKQMASGKIREKDPKRAMNLLKEARTNVEASGLDPQARTQLLRRVDRSIGELDKYINENRSQIELDASNKEVLKDVDRRREAKIEVDDKLARLVDDFNKLMDQQRYQEAEVLAKRARELDPENPLVKQLIWQSRFVSRTRRNSNLKEDKEKGAWETWDSVEQAAIPFDDRDPIRFRDAKEWSELTKSRAKLTAENRGRKTERELDIERKLKTPVSLKFRNRPLSEVLDQLAKLASVNLHLDEKGLEEEGVSSDTPVTIDLTTDISLKSALNLILEPKHLGYVISDEVLKITSEQLRDGKIYPMTYNVADLVIPIPNFAPNGRIGLAGALSDAYSLSGGSMGGPGTGYLASHDGTQASGVVHPNVLAQINQLMPGGSRPAMAGNPAMPMGPGGVGGGNQADFDTLIDLITTTVKPQTWDEVGGPGSISRFPNNLSLVISQTQEVHEEIVDLLEQLRRNQDLQVTIEVRFITLNDNFFEQIGVDFQANIVNANVPKDPNGNGNKKEIVGLLPPVDNFPNFTSNLDIPFRQSSFTLATPQFGQPTQVASFGFAILSDLEAYLLINASQGDRRSNVLQAPKVTMFNGQQASVFDTTSTPFVISVIPVVGDFAAAYQPVITVLSEGTSLTVQSVISNDRRFVRLTVIPFFSQIGEVKEFTFSGSRTTTSNTSASKSAGGASGDSTASADGSTTTSDGITLQLPNFSVVSVNTTVSVPDGGTVLLGGIKRLSEGRNEFGVPILSKLPYINRLFKNVGIGRETQSLMMMVTPRIIIQEEEEERLGIQAPP